MVRNRTPSEAQEGLEPLERHLREKSFFDTQPWNELEESHRGTQSLKKYLAALLCSRIQEAFPNILSSIRTQQDSVQSALDSLGASRKTVEQKRTYLTTIAQHYHSMASQALRGRYDVIYTSDMRLRMRVRQYNDEFALDMKNYGHSTPFIQIQKIKYDSHSSSSGSERKLDSKTCTPQPLEASTNGEIFGGFGTLSVGFPKFPSSTFSLKPSLVMKCNESSPTGISGVTEKRFRVFHTRNAIRINPMKCSG